MVLLDNTLRHDAKNGSASGLRTGCALVGKPAGTMHPRRRIGAAMTRASTLGNGNSPDVPNTIEGNIRAGCAERGCNLAARDLRRGLARKEKRKIGMCICWRRPAGNRCLFTFCRYETARGRSQSLAEAQPLA